QRRPAASARGGTPAGKNFLAVVAEPAVAELPPLLADPARRQLELPAQVPGALVAGHRPDQAPLTAREGLQPGREVDPERDLIGDRGEGVVAQPLLEGVEQRLAVGRRVELLVRAAGRGGQVLDTEAVRALGDRGEHLPGPLVA